MVFFPSLLPFVWPVSAGPIFFFPLSFTYCFVPFLSHSPLFPSQFFFPLYLDHEPNSERAVEWVLTKFLKKNDALTLLHVFDFEPVVTMDLYGSLSTAKINMELEAHGEREAVNLLKRYGKKCAEFGVNAHLTALKGPVKHSIMDYVEEQQPDVLLISSRGLGAVKRWFLGSVSDFCVHNCKCPVLVIKSEEQEEDKDQ